MKCILGDGREEVLGPTHGILRTAVIANKENFFILSPLCAFNVLPMVPTVLPMVSLVPMILRMVPLVYEWYH